MSQYMPSTCGRLGLGREAYGSSMTCCIRRVRRAVFGLESVMYDCIERPLGAVKGQRRRIRSTRARASSGVVISPLSWASRTASSRREKWGPGVRPWSMRSAPSTSGARVEPFGRPGESLAAEGEGGIVGAGDGFGEQRRVRRRRRG